MKYNPTAEAVHVVGLHLGRARTPLPEVNKGEDMAQLPRIYWGIPTVTQAWGLWALLGAAMLLLLISVAAHLFRWASGRSKSRPGQGRSGESVEEVPLYGNLPYLQTGRLAREPGPDQQDPTPRGPVTAAEKVMCYTSLQLRPSQGHIPSPGTPIKYSEVVLDSEPKPQASGPEPELYASVCAQTRRTRASFPDQAYANSQPAPS
ncbi:signaling threshold-regulating transmembrane adapter 1 isoform X1 [Leptonychotes weddellii]|uniref:Signaling threshold-regulating transmembrane adapter 1 isoform X1 n=1 Tax=Leptonychotes weddellii TaxID=9713 RepID=A0A7F8Q118_LEPWE|nr:signaling threshold-regulating transmembrane adapter 1 isoform X1 [Leptonychotes weddellii]